MSINLHRKAVISGIFIFITGALAQTVFAQVLEEIVVTAQSRQQSNMDVPVSLEVVSGDDILQEGYRTIESLSAYSPTLNIGGSIHGQSIRIRGIGTQGNNLALEQSVPIFLDRNHVGRGEQVYSAFIDVERVEVLRGPQPVYFGQNASAGAISITSRKPTPEWEGYVAGEAGNNGAHLVELGVGGPVSDTFGIRVAGKYDDSDGFAIDTITGKKIPAEQNWASRVTLSWKPSDALAITAAGSISKVSNEGRVTTAVAYKDDNSGYGALDTYMGGIFVLDDKINNRIMHPGPPFLAPPVDLRRGFISTNQDLVDLSQIAVTGGNLPFKIAGSTLVKPKSASLTIDYEFANGMVLFAQSGYSKLDVEYVRFTRPQGPFILNTIARFVDEKQFNQEVILSSQSGGTFEWATGIYYQDNSRDQGADNLNPDFCVAGTESGGRLCGHLRTRAAENGRWASVFANVTFNISDFSVDLGGRYTDVHKDAIHESFIADYIVTGGGLATNHLDVVTGITSYRPVVGADSVPDINNADFDEDRFNPQVVVRYHPNDNINYYVKYAEAFKAGGFDTSVVAVVPAEDFVLLSEVGENYEVGMKGRFLDGTVSAELIGFWSKFQNLQVSSFDEVLGRQRTLNAAAQRVRGVEFNAQWAATERLILGINGNIQSGKFLDYPGANCTAVEVEVGECGTGGIPGKIDRSGQDALRTPNYVFNMKVDYEYPVLDRYKMRFSGLFRYADAYLLNFDQSIIQDKTFNTNLNIGIGPEDDRWEVSVYGRNLTNPVPTYQPEFNRSSRTLEQEVVQNYFRTYGVQFKYDFF